MESLDLGNEYRPIEAAIHSVRYDFAIECRPVGRVLDVSCGYGYGSLLLSRAEAVTEVVGVDRDPRALEFARAHAGDGSRLSFRPIDLDDATALEALGRFDTIVSIETLEHLSDPALILARLKSIWTGRGPIVISYPNDALYYGRGRSLNPYHLNSGSWIDVRQWSEKILGEGQWFFGTVANGFAVFPVGPASRSVDYLGAFGEAGGTVRGRHLPGPAGDDRLLPQNAIFYVGVWRTEAAEASRPAVSVYPTSSFTRVPDFFAPPRSVQMQQRPKLLLVADVENWAYDNIAKNIALHLSDRFEIEIAYQNRFEGDWHGALYHYLFESDARFVHFFWRETILNLLLTPWTMSNFCKRFGISAADFADRMSQVVLTASIYDHLYLDGEDLRVRIPRFATLDGLSVSSKRLASIYAGKLPGQAPIVIEDGVDLSMFVPRKMTRFDERQRPLVVGWVGNSAWNSDSDRDPKGLHTILKPAIASLRAQGIDVAEHYADRNERWRSRAEMAEYYGEIDVLVCCSETEGTPNPVLEAVACGVPVVTTDVGIVRETLGPMQQQFVLAERSRECLAAALARLHGERSLLKALSDENVSRRDGLDWLTRMPRWLNLFKRAEANQERARHLKRALYETLVTQRFHTDWVEEKASGLEAANKRLRHDLRTFCPYCEWLGDRVRQVKRAMRMLSARSSG